MNNPQLKDLQNDMETAFEKCEELLSEQESYGNALKSKLYTPEGVAISAIVVGALGYLGYSYYKPNKKKE